MHPHIDRTVTGGERRGGECSGMRWGYSVAGDRPDPQQTGSPGAHMGPHHPPSQVHLHPQAPTPDSVGRGPPRC